MCTKSRDTGQVGTETQGSFFLRWGVEAEKSLSNGVLGYENQRGGWWLEKWGG